MYLLNCEGTCADRFDVISTELAGHAWCILLIREGICADRIECSLRSLPIALGVPILNL